MPNQKHANPNGQTSVENRPYRITVYIPLHGTSINYFASVVECFKWYVAAFRPDVATHIEIIDTRE